MRRMVGEWQSGGEPRRTSGVKVVGEDEIIVVTRVRFVGAQWQKTYQYFKVFPGFEIVTGYRALYLYDTLEKAMENEDSSWRELNPWAQ